MRRTWFTFRLRTLVFLVPLLAIAAGLGVRFYLESQIEPMEDVFGDGSFLQEVQQRNRQYYHVVSVPVDLEGPICEEAIHLELVNMLGRFSRSGGEETLPGEDPFGEDPFGTTPALADEENPPSENPF